MFMLSNINLPLPDVDFIISISDILSSTKPNPVFEENRQRHLRRFKNSVNVARCEYYKHPELDLYSKKTYQPYFAESITPVIIKLVNVEPSTPSYYIPHVDQKRIAALNYYVYAGGPNVTTSYYTDEGDNDNTGTVKTYEEVTLLSRNKMNDRSWYLLDANRYHSVENIIDIRIAYSLSFSDLTVIDFQKKYSNLVPT